jgi:hypothetical protein
MVHALSSTFEFENRFKPSVPLPCPKDPLMLWLSNLIDENHNANNIKL